MKEILESLMIFICVSLLVLGIVVSVQSADTAHRQPTVQELLQSFKTEVIKDLTTAMIKSENIGRIEMAMQIPCAKIYVSSKTVYGQTYYGVEANIEGCK